MELSDFERTVWDHLTTELMAAREAAADETDGDLQNWKPTGIRLDDA